MAAFTGPAAELGKRMQTGMQAYFAAVNAQGGVNGRRIKLISRDDGYEPETTTAAAKALVATDKMFAIAGTVGTPTGLALLPIVHEANVPVVGMFTGAQALREPLNRNLFHVRASYYDETERIVEHLFNLGLKKIAVFYQTDAYGKAGLQGVERAMTRRGQTPVALATVERDSTDMAKALEKILAAKPDAVVQISAYRSCAALIKEAHSRKFAGQFFNVSFVGSNALSAELGDEGRGVVISQVVPSPYRALTPVAREYQQHMTAAGEKAFDFVSFEGHLSARVLVEGLRRAGQFPTRETLVAGLETMRNFSLGGYVVSFSPNSHEGSHLVDLTMIGKGGRFIY
ncbi:MAG: ABC transporter substrate-binding protein [Burkholderiales bacterium]